MRKHRYCVAHHLSGRYVLVYQVEFFNIQSQNKKEQRMQTENGKIEGNVSINGSLQMNGMFTGDVTVENGAYLILNGMATQSVTLKKGGSLEVNGTVVGVIYNQGGSLVVKGVVKEIVEQI